MNSASELWAVYRKNIYKTSKPLPGTQERECSLAFYAGMKAAFWRLSELADKYPDEKKGAKACEEFRQDIKAASFQANLDRSDGLS
jgi:hypothetical protein